MKITIEIKSSGIHDYASIDVEQPHTTKMWLMKEIMRIIEEYNKNEVDKA